jgi:hypothetical protein
MRRSGGRTKSRGSLRAKRKQSAKSVASRLRSGSGAPTPDSRRSTASPRKDRAATAASVASNTSSQKSGAVSAKKSTPPVKSRRKQLERFVPEQRHLFGSDRAVKLPCPETKR